MPFKAITLVPIIDLSAKLYTFVNTDATGDCVSAAPGASAVGVLQTPGIAKEPCNVMVAGVSFIVLDTAVAAGESISVGASNGAAKATAAIQGSPTVTGIAGTEIIGICLVGGAIGDTGSILLK